MNGYVFVAGKNVLESNLLKSPKELKGGRYNCKFEKSDHFKDDKLFFKKDNLLCLLDGVILNKDELMRSKPDKSWEDVYFELVQNSAEEIANRLRGSFSGLIYDEYNEKVWAFTDHVASRGVFYTIKDNVLIVTSHLKLIAEAMENVYGGVKPSVQGCQEMLLVGAPMHGNTVFDGVRRLLGGKYVYYGKDRLLEKRYHIFRNVPEHESTLDECIERCDGLLRKAVDRIYRKNDEYGYRYLADLSGGLDSRLVNWVANDLGYKNALNICWSMEGKADHTISKKMAKRLGNGYFFYPMNRGEEIICDVDKVIDKTGGIVNYFMGTGVNRLLDEVDLSNVGMEITGLLGELHNAYWIEEESDEHTPPKYIGSSYFSQGMDFKCPGEYSKEYENFEQMQLYEYSVILWMSGGFVRQDRVEVCSPFVDKDFLEFAYRIPLKWRRNHYFTMAWMCKKYPEAAKFLWQAEMKPVESVFHNKIYPPKAIYVTERLIARAYNKICRVLRINSGLAYLNEMNPVHIWFMKEKNIRRFYAEYYKKYRGLVKDRDLYKLMLQMMNSNIAVNQVSVINLLAIYKLYFA